MSETSPLLAIKCLTYNHEPYIRQCLEGFVMQKTNFPFIAIVHDDASTDNTADIIREYAEKYPDIIKPIYETVNQYSKHDGSVGRIMNAAIPESVKYIAVCEGDDYWTDSLKLQKQVDFLENHPEYGLVYSRVKYYNEKNKKYTCVFGNEVNSFIDLTKRNTIPTLSIVVRHGLLKNYYETIKPKEKSWKMGDYPMCLYCSYYSKLKFLPDITGIYRILENSASHFKSEVQQLEFGINSYEIAIFMCEYFGESSILPHINQIWLKFEKYCLTGDKENINKVVLEAIELSKNNNSLKLKIIPIFAKRSGVFLYFLNLYRKIHFTLKNFFNLLSILWRAMSAIPV